MWGPEDTVGLLSCIIGSAWFIAGPIVAVVIAYPASYLAIAQTMLLLLLIGGAAFLTMGIVAVANDSKIGIGGIIIGALEVLAGIPVFWM